eukprot:7002056-Prymnesium_polylepis.1
MQKYMTAEGLFQGFKDMGIFWDVCHSETKSRICTHVFAMDTHAPFLTDAHYLCVPTTPLAVHQPWCAATQWGSLCQKDPALWHLCCGGPTFVEPEARSKAEKAAAEACEASRSAKEKEAFSKVLHETMDLWYAHQGTTVYMLTQLPEGCARK